MQAITDWWNNISGREQILVSLIAVFGVFAAFYYAAWRPISEAHRQVLLQLESSYEDHQWLQKQTQTLEKLRSRLKGTLPVFMTLKQLEETVKKQLKEKNIEGTVQAIDSVNDVTGGFLKIEISGNAVAVMKWLESVANAGHQIDLINLENSDNWLTGMVSVRTRQTSS